MKRDELQLPMFEGLPYRPQEARPARTRARTLYGSEELPFRSGVDYADALAELSHKDRTRLLRSRGSYLYLDREGLLTHFEVERVSEALHAVLDMLQPVYAWWNRVTGPRAMTTWWTIRGGRIRTWNGKAPLWLVFGSSNARFVQRASDIIQRTGALMHVEPGPEPLQEGLELAELLLDGELHRFGLEQDSHPLMFLGPAEGPGEKKVGWLRQLA